MSKIKVDLHCHSIHSDGRLSVKQLIEKASEEKVTHMALTDHDTVAGVKKAIKLGKKRGVEVIAGIELSTYRNDETIHIIGLFKKNIVPKAIFKYQKQMKKVRFERAKKMMRLVRKHFEVNIDFKDLFKNGKNVSRGTEAAEKVPKIRFLRKTKIKTLIIPTIFKIDP